MRILTSWFSVLFIPLREIYFPLENISIILFLYSLTVTKHALIPITHTEKNHEISYSYSIYCIQCYPNLWTSVNNFYCRSLLSVSWVSIFTYKILYILSFSLNNNSISHLFRSLTQRNGTDMQLAR